MRRTLIAFSLALLVTAPAQAQKQDPLVAAPKKPEHELRLLRVGKTFQGLRFNVRTGETWVIIADHYEKVPEPAPLAPGEYDITLVTDDTNSMGFRIDRVTGMTWMLRNRMWTKVKEPDEKDQ